MQRVEPGPVGQRVPREVRALRERLRLSTYELSRKLAEIGWPLRPAALTKIENGQRKVDVDDLAALAVALNASPVRLMTGVPHDEPVFITPHMNLGSVGATWLGEPLREEAIERVTNAVRQELEQPFGEFLSGIEVRDEERERGGE